VRARSGIRWLLPASLLIPSLAWASLRWDWTAKERACAQKIGVVLGGAPQDKFYVRQMTWLSDAAVRGTVTGLRHDESTGFPTTVVLDLKGVLKGEGLPRSIEIMLNRGPVHSDVYGGMVEIVGPDPAFEVGEEVLVFLIGERYSSALLGSEGVALNPHQFGLLDKWTLAGDGSAANGYACASSTDDKSCGPERVDRLDHMEREIALARSAQEDCR